MKKLSRVDAEKLALESLELEKEAQERVADLIKVAGEKAYYASNEWSPRERAIYSLGWSHAKVVGVEQAVRTLYGPEGIGVLCQAYEEVVERASKEGR